MMNNLMHFRIKRWLDFIVGQKIIVPYSGKWDGGANPYEAKIISINCYYSLPDATVTVELPSGNTY